MINLTAKFSGLDEGKKREESGPKGEGVEMNSLEWKTIQTGWGMKGWRKRKVYQYFKIRR